MPKQRRATHEEMTKRVKRRVVEIVNMQDAMKRAWQDGLMSREEWMRQHARLAGQLQGQRELLSYALWGELEEVCSS